MGCGQSSNKTSEKCAIIEKQEQNCSSPTPVTRSKSTMEMFMTNQQRTAILNMGSLSPSIRILLSPPFSNFSSFNQQLYLTALGGITLDNLKQYHIKCLINLAEEIPEHEFERLDNSSILYFKYPVIIATLPIIMHKKNIFFYLRHVTTMILKSTITSIGSSTKSAGSFGKMMAMLLSIVQLA